MAVEAPQSIEVDEVFLVGYNPALVRLKNGIPVGAMSTKITGVNELSHQKKRSWDEAPSSLVVRWIFTSMGQWAMID